MTSATEVSVHRTRSHQTSFLSKYALKEKTKMLNLYFLIMHYITCCFSDVVRFHFNAFRTVFKYAFDKFMHSNHDPDPCSTV